MGVAMLVWLLLMAGGRAMTAPQLSESLFGAFGILALGFCLLSGVFLTADCLSEEKREGTLGLLFLADLRSYDVILGKLTATSISSIYGLLAIFPILAVPFLMGGVTAGEFWRVVLVLLVTLMMSLNVGILTSTLCREARQAMSGTFLGILILTGVLPAIYWVEDLMLRSRQWNALLVPSPAYA
jgi:ABC-type transport system involved in multi-copper enzyme maturation permease subunit